MCLGNISGRALYALRLMRPAAILSIAETVLYVAYTAAFVRWWGVTGAAIGFRSLHTGAESHRPARKEAR